MSEHETKYAGEQTANGTSEKKLSDIPMYRHTLEYAKSHGETSNFYESNRANQQCVKMIAEAINSKNPRGFYHDAISTFGKERAESILAASIHIMNEESVPLPLPPIIRAWTESVAEKVPDLFPADEKGDPISYLTDVSHNFKEIADFTTSSYIAMQTMDKGKNPDIYGCSALGEIYEKPPIEIPVLKMTDKEAYRAGAGELWEKNDQLNKLCSLDVQKCLSKSVGVADKEQLTSIMRKYGNERTMMVIANMIPEWEKSGNHFSKDNKEWAQSKYQIQDNEWNTWKDTVISEKPLPVFPQPMSKLDKILNPDKLNRFVSLARGIENSRDKDAAQHKKESVRLRCDKIQQQMKEERKAERQDKKRENGMDR